MKKMTMFLLKVTGLILLLLLIFIAFGIGYSRIKPRYDRWYYNRLNLQPSVAPVALDSEVITTLDRHFSRQDFGNVSNFIVWQDGEVRYQFEQEEGNANQADRVWSISKSVVSAAYGVAIQQDKAASLDSPLANHLPSYADDINSDPRRAAITIEDLFTMRSGFMWDELTGYPSDYHRFAASEDWLGYMAGREMARRPGDLFVYNTANTILLGQAIGQQVDQPFESYVAEHLFAELGIENWDWQRGPNGVTQAGGGLYLSANDMLKIGQLYLQNGMWQGKQLVDPNWVAASTSFKTDVEGYLDYGYHWWVVPADAGLVESLAVKDVYFASGLGGNYIFVVPHLNTVVSITAQDPGGAMERAWPALRYFVFPALTAESQN